MKITSVNGAQSSDKEICFALESIPPDASDIFAYFRKHISSDPLCSWFTFDMRGDFLFVTAAKEKLAALTSPQPQFVKAVNLHLAQAEDEVTRTKNLAEHSRLEFVRAVAKALNLEIS